MSTGKAPVGIENPDERKPSSVDTPTRKPKNRMHVSCTCAVGCHVVFCDKHDTRVFHTALSIGAISSNHCSCSIFSSGKPRSILSFGRQTGGSGELRCVGSIRRAPPRAQGPVSQQISFPPTTTLHQETANGFVAPTDRQKSTLEA